MSQRNPKLIDLDFAPPRDRRPPLDDVTVSDTVEGATSEIRSLMDQLQQTANEARHRLHDVERERDSLSEQVQSLQEQTRDLRGRAGEAAVLGQQLDRLEKERGDMEQQLQAAQRGGGAAPEEISRQRDEARRQRDDLMRSIEGLNRTVTELNERFAAGQAQLLGVRQARDGTQSRNRELEARIVELDDLVADLEYRLEKGAPAAPADDAERMALTRQIAELQTALAAAVAKEGAGKLLDEALTHAHGELEELRAAHQSVLAEAAALRAEAERLRKTDSASEPGREAMDSLRHEYDTARVQVQMATREVMDLRAQLQIREGEIAGLERSRQGLTRQAAEMQGQFQPLAEEREAAVRARDETLTSLASAQKQIERVGKERDLLRDTGTQQTIALERQLAERETALEEERREKREAQAHLEAQRLETIELGTRLLSAQEQVRNLSASLAEVRLRARAAGRAPGPVAPSLPAQLLPPSVQPGPAPAPEPPLEAFPSLETHRVVREMRRCYQAYARDPDDLSHLNELHCAAHTFAEEARAGGCVALHRLGLAFAGLVQELYHFPEQITSEVLTTVVQSIEFLTTILKVRDLRHLKDPGLGSVSVIDDDAATRECIILALETVLVRILAFHEPSEALCTLARTPCDLIFMDVEMPGMNGYELCSQVRQHALHQHTPIIFVTGNSGPEARAKAQRCGGNDFLNKPFILAELALKALMVMVRSELHLA